MNYDNSLVVPITVTCDSWAPSSEDHLFTCGASCRPPQWLVAILEWKNWRGNCGAMEKSSVANINVSPVWWFSIVMKTDLLWLNLSNPHRLVNIVRTVVRKSLNHLKFCWLKVICFICQSNELEREIKQKTGGQQKIWGAWPTQVSP